MRADTNITFIVVDRYLTEQFSKYTWILKQFQVICCSDRCFAVFKDIWLFRFLFWNAVSWTARWRWWVWNQFSLDDSRGRELHEAFRVTRPHFREPLQRYGTIGHSQIIAGTSDNYLRCSSTNPSAICKPFYVKKENITIYSAFQIFVHSWQ